MASEPWVNAEKAAWGSDLVMSESRSSSVFHAATLSIVESLTNSGVPRAARRCRLPVQVMWIPVSAKILLALGRCSSFTTSHDLELFV